MFPMALLTVVVGGLIFRPPLAAYFIFAYLGAVLAGIPAAVVDLVQEFKRER